MQKSLNNAVYIAQEELAFLKNYPYIKREATDRYIEQLLNGYSKIIRRLNIILKGDVPSYLPRVQQLKNKLQGKRLISFKFADHDFELFLLNFYKAIGNAKRMMRNGEYDYALATSDQSPVYPDSEKIITTAAPTHGRALTCAIVAHLIEQTQKAALDIDFNKDDVIAALEYVSVLLFYENPTDPDIAEIFRVAVHPYSTSFSGGAGWLKPSRVTQILDGHIEQIISKEI